MADKLRDFLDEVIWGLKSDMYIYEKEDKKMVEKIINDWREMQPKYEERDDKYHPQLIK